MQGTSARCPTSLTQSRAHALTSQRQRQQQQQQQQQRFCTFGDGARPAPRAHVKATAGEMPPMQLAHPSPKRKRDQPQQIPLLNTALAIRPAHTPPRRDSPAPSSGPDSPRNAVADQLRGMTLIATAAIPMSPLTPTDNVTRKKPKLGALDVDDGDGPSAQTAQAHTKPRNKVGILDAAALGPVLDAAREIPETPQAPRPRIVTDTAAFAQPRTLVSSCGSTRSSQTWPSSQTSDASASTDRSQSQPRPQSSTPPPSALTWQDDEITGHLTGPANDPDDDGTGLNGIGFKPTPAIAYQRAQRRKQQLQDWKARETREARAKRSQRRNRGVGARPRVSRESTVEREAPHQLLEVPRRKVQFSV
ncbi:uncharacterized protein M421DRAFT_140795 [Didymella exigua CBS 183.55]|uniref:Uncharacterized protein n=1 Tax=Didymella exigua CBS 183.55 TaxID=1150837 RepID=A0A6A5RN22_9PLEO|nr:uncharacterized protein M421DRAFT_140795 [Didymella exigua CBS 183.55]KAF1928833.1 hypothetical protein M421DRAFT_140795 [Didymella exigua CBS 183.55]